MIVWLSIIIIVLLLIQDTDTTSERVSILGYSAKYFYMSHGESKKIFDKMYKDGISDESLKHFIMMEDKLLNLERLSVCTQTTRKLKRLLFLKR